MAPETKQSSLLTNGPPPRVFTDVGLLLANPGRWADWLAQNADRAELFADAFRVVVRLEAHTGWTIGQVLEQLGCGTKTEQQLSKLGEERLRRCSAYMSWVESLVRVLDVRTDKRLTVSGAARLFVSADEDLAACGHAMSTGEFPALDYLRLGEVAQAWDSARFQLNGPEGERTRRTLADNPFMSENPHLSPERVDMLLGADAEWQLGPKVTLLMREHLRFCPACAAQTVDAELARDEELEASRIRGGPPAAPRRRDSVPSM